jgi:hypothetical protein
MLHGPVQVANTHGERFRISRKSVRSENLLEQWYRLQSNARLRPYNAVCASLNKGTTQFRKSVRVSTTGRGLIDIVYDFFFLNPEQHFQQQASKPPQNKLASTRTQNRVSFVQVSSVPNIYSPAARSRASQAFDRGLCGGVTKCTAPGVMHPVVTSQYSSTTRYPRFTR